MKFNKYWFRPKYYGYGAYPSSWEGWTFISIMVIILLAGILFITPYNIIPYLLFIIIWIIIVIIISYKKTEGMWKWRWGKKK